MCPPKPKVPKLPKVDNTLPPPPAPPEPTPQRVEESSASRKAEQRATSSRKRGTSSLRIPLIGLPQGQAGINLPN